MSIKSLLQLILFILIILVLGGVYFLYFYVNPNENLEIKSTISKNLNNQDNLTNEASDRENLEEIVLNEENLINNDYKDDRSKKIDINNDQQNKNKTDREKNINKDDVLDEIKNLTKEIEYVTSNNNGDIFKISAKYGKTNLKDTRVLDLEQVVGLITSSQRSEIYLTSDYAKYNYTNQNSKFFDNVEIKYDEKIIYCDNLELEMSKNIAVAYGNVLIKDKKSLMKAQKITMDIVTKDISINSSEGVGTLTN
tara:strand:+ start:336 stop:1091 length:756 start_codon:yes stop_codon:yes gene_type:complete